MHEVRAQRTRQVDGAAFRPPPAPGEPRGEPAGQLLHGLGGRALLLAAPALTEALDEEAPPLGRSASRGFIAACGDMFVRSLDVMGCTVGGFPSRTVGAVLLIAAVGTRAVVLGLP